MLKKSGSESSPGGRGVPVILVAVLLCSAIFVLDAASPLGLGIGFLYVTVVLLGLGAEDPRFVPVASLVCAVLIVLGVFLSVPRPIAPIGIVLVNRSLALVVVLATGVLAWRRNLAEGQRERLAAIIESSDDAILGETIEGIVTTWNAGAERVYGYTPSEVLGRMVDFLLPEDRPDEIRGILKRIAQGERIEHFETVRRCKDGRLIHVSLSVSPVKDDSGRIVGASAIARDITERVKTEERLREQAALARLGGMAAVVAHEVKNPLAGIGGALHIIRDRMPPEASDRTVIGEILARLDALNLLVEDLLLFARPKPPRFAPIAMRQLLEKTAAHLKRDPGFHEVAVAIQGDDAGLSADPQLLSSAFLNLFLNGAQAMGRKGELRVDVRTDDGCCTVEVRDSGPGIPGEVLPRIFEPFFTTRHRGTGLGLPVVKRVVEAHGGQIEITCPQEGGTVASVRLPLLMPSKG